VFLGGAGRARSGDAEADELLVRRLDVDEGRTEQVDHLRLGRLAVSVLELVGVDGEVVQVVTSDVA
jgi:hypothetical protein